MPKPLTMWITTLWKILKEMGLPDHLTCLLRNLYAGQEATIRTGHGKMYWFHIGKGVCQGCILSPCLFNLYAEYIMLNAGLDEAQAGIKISRRNINNLTICSDFGAQEKKICHCTPFCPIYLPRSDGTICHDLSFLSVEFKPAFSLSSFTFIKRLLVPLHFLP